MQPLHLPPAQLTIVQRNGADYVLDVLRRRYVRLTPEEWVRQHFVAYLVHHRGYPAGLLGNEVSLRLNGMQRRCDTVLFDRECRPRMILEYKAPHVALSQRVVDQVCRYDSVLDAPWLVVSNGLCHHCFRRSDDDAGLWTAVPEIPDYDRL